MALTSEEEQLVEEAKAAMPRWYRTSADHVLCGFAKMFGPVLTLIRYWLGEQAFIGTADGSSPTTPDWLGQHALDRGTSRQNGESDAALRERLKDPTVAVIAASLLEAAQNLLTQAGVGGTPYLIELPRDGAFYGDNTPITGTGGTFVLVSGTTWKFTPDDPDGALTEPPYDSTGKVVWKLVISGAANAGNNGTFTVTEVRGNGVTFINASGVAATDPTLTWRFDRYAGHDNAFLTGSGGRAKAYYNRGFRANAGRPCVVVMLPYGTSENLRLAVYESIRQRKAAGVRLIVERRLNP